MDKNLLACETGFDRVGSTADILREPNPNSNQWF